MVGEGREGTDVGEERRDGGAVVESGGQMNARVIFDERSICGHTHTLTLVQPCVLAHSAHVFVLLIGGRLKVIWKCRTSAVKASAALVLQLTFVCLSFGHTNTQFRLSVF